MFTQHFFVEGKYLGSAVRVKVFVHAELQRPLGGLFFCGQCGDVWAKTPIDQCEFQSYRIACRKHGGGSMWLSWEPEFVAAFPLAVLRWEFERELEKQGL